MKLARVLLAGLLIGFSVKAEAQQAVLQGGPWAPNHVPMYVGGGSSFPVLGDSGAAGGSPNGGITEMQLTARGTGNPPYANAGTGPNGSNWCDYDAPTTSPNGYHYFCISPNSSGSTLMSTGAVGTTALPLQISVNGTVYPFPGNGNGNVIGPVTSVVNNIPTFGNTSGSLLKDQGIAPTTAGSLVQANGTSWTASTIALPTSAGINTMLAATSANTFATIAAANNSVLATNGSGVPSLTTSLPALQYIGTQSFNGGIYTHVRTVTASGAITVAATDQVIIVNQGSPAAVIVNYACPAGVNGAQFTFTVKDGAGQDATYPITLTPATGTTVDGATTFIMNTSSNGAPPYDSRSVVCDDSGNSWIY